MSLTNKMVCAALMTVAGLQAAGSDDNGLVSAGTKLIGNSSAHIVHQSGTLTRYNVSRDATPTEIELAEKNAQWELEHYNQSALQKFGSSLDQNLRYVATAEPFGIPYGFSIAAVGVAGYYAYQWYKKPKINDADQNSNDKKSK